MKTVLLRLSPALAVVMLLALSSPAQATIFRRARYVAPAYRVSYSPGHMPGWDWRRTYPWSPYNYGRNPYNPVVYPYYVQPYPVYVNPAPVYVNPTPTPTNGPPPVVTYSPVSVSPTANTGVIRVNLPDTFAQVQFNGQAMPGVGSTRYYVTPPLPRGQYRQYTVTATWTGNVGQTVTTQHTAEVMAGQTTVMWFGR